MQQHRRADAYTLVRRQDSGDRRATLYERRRSIYSRNEVVFYRRASASPTTECGEALRSRSDEGCAEKTTPSATGATPPAASSVFERAQRAPTDERGMVMA